MNKFLKESRNALLTHQKYSDKTKNVNNKQKFKLGRLKSQENAKKSDNFDLKTSQNKSRKVSPFFNKNILKKTIKKISKRSIAELLHKNTNQPMDERLNFIRNNTAHFQKKFLPNKGMHIEQGSNMGRDILIKSLYNDIKIRNIINLWNELEVNESYRTYFFFIYRELNTEGKSNLYHKEINELIQLKNDIKSLTYNIELRIGIVNKLEELNDELNNEREDGKVEQNTLDQMFKKMEDLTMQAVDIVKYMKKIKTVVNLLPNLNKYNLDIISRKFNFDKNYLIKMKFETNFLNGGYIQNELGIDIDQAPFLIKAKDKDALFCDDKENNVMLCDQKVINDIIDCNYFIYKTNINFYTHEFFNRKEKLVSALNDKKKNIVNNIFNNYLINAKKDLLIDNKMNNSARYIKNKDLFNAENYNNNKILPNFDEKFKQISSIKIKKSDLINFQKDLKRNDLNDSGIILSKKLEKLKINKKTPYLNNDDIIQIKSNDIFSNINSK